MTDTKSLSTAVLVGLGALSWSATGYGFFALATGGEADGVTSVLIGVLAAGMAAAIQILMMLFFFRAAQPKQVSPTRWLFAAGCLVCMLLSVTFGVNSYSKYLGTRAADQVAQAESEIQQVGVDWDVIDGYISGMLVDLRLIRGEVNNIAEGEGDGTASCQTICAIYTAYRGVLDAAIEGLQREQSALEAEWSQVQTMELEDQAVALRRFHGALEGARARIAPTAAIARAEALINDESTAQAGSGPQTRGRAADFLQQLEAVRVLGDRSIPETSVLGEAFQDGPVAGVEQAMATVVAALTGDWNTLTGKEKGILFLALIIDVFILLVMIWKRQETTAITASHEALVEKFGSSVTPIERIVQDAGYGSVSDAINAMEANGSGALGYSPIFGQVVVVPVPRSTNMLNTLMVNLKNAGMAIHIPWLNSQGGENTRETHSFWVPKNPWRELQAVKTLSISTPRLSATMTFGEFVDWACRLPDGVRLPDGAKPVRNTLARYFPFAWSLPMNELTQTKVEESLEAFERAAKQADLKEGTKKRYRRMFQDMLLLAAQQGMLPQERLNADLQLVA